MNKLWMLTILIIGLIIGIFLGIFQYENTRWNEKSLIGLTGTEAIQVLGLPDDKFPIHNSLLWIDSSNNKVLKIELDSSGKVNSVSILNVFFSQYDDINYQFSAQRLLEVNNKCKLLGYSYLDTCKKRQEEINKVNKKLGLP